MSAWYENCYRRNLVDMHIDDWNEEFLSKLSVEEYISCLVKARVQNVMVYAQSHVGLCYWPTSYGRMHKGLKGRDFIGEFVNKAHKKDISVVLYYSLIYDNWSYEHHPEWRLLNVLGLNTRDKNLEWEFSGSRCGVLCPNQLGYREYAKNQVQELASRYSPEGIFLDMTFWGGICLCDECKKRFQKECGISIPDTIDWTKPEWLSFQRKREEWIAEFANFITKSIKAVNKNITVSHNSAPMERGYQLGVSEKSAESSDYLGGDLYEGFVQASFASKYYRNITKNMPFEFMTSRCSPGLKYHTSNKSVNELKLNSYIALAHGGAFLFIDAINPDGTLNPDVYTMMGDVFDETKEYEKYCGGELKRDVGVYFSQQSKSDWKNNGMSINKLVMPKGEHLESVKGVVEILRDNNIPFDVISRNKLSAIEDCQVVILPNLRLIDDEEAELLISYVEKGGNLLVTSTPMNKKIQKLIGIEFTEQTKENFTYMKPNESGLEIMPGYSLYSPLTMPEKQDKVSFEADTEVLATITLPYTNPEDSTIFASIWANPPGIDTDYPSIIKRKVGNGTIIWTAASIESTSPDANKNVFCSIVRSLHEKPLKFESDAPWPVELLLYEQPENKRYVLHILNEQYKMPVIPIGEFNVSLNVGDKVIKNVWLANEDNKCQYECVDGLLNIHVSGLEIYRLIIVDFENVK